MKFYIDTNGNYYTPSQVAEMVLDGETPPIKVINNVEIDLLEEIGYHLNENGRFFTETEMEQNILDYYVELQYSKKNKKPTHTIHELLQLIDYEGGEGANWIRTINTIIAIGNNERYVVGKDPNTKGWFIYDNETNRNVCWCETEEECYEVIASDFRALRENSWLG